MQYKFKDSEIGRILRNLVVLVDTREQANDHIIQYFKDNISYILGFDDNTGSILMTDK